MAIVILAMEPTRVVAAATPACSVTEVRYLTPIRPAWFVITFVTAEEVKTLDIIPVSAVLKALPAIPLAAFIPTI